MHIHIRSDAIARISPKEISLTLPSKTLQWTKPSRSLLKQMRKLIHLEENEEGVDFFYLLEILKEGAFLSYTILDHNKPFITLTPNEKTELDQNKELPTTLSLKISRFAYLKISDQNQITLLSPLFNGTITFQNSNSLLLFYALSHLKSIDVLSQEFSSISKKAISHFFSLLYQANFLSNSDQNPSLIHWEFHDLLFHANSRNRMKGRSGATYRFLNQLPPTPPLREKPSPLISLFEPNLDFLKKSDPSFTEVIEKRKSIRNHGEKTITKDQLGEFLYRTARVKEIKQAVHYQATSRPYPGGGACYELEIYPLIDQCSGLPQGLYRYHPDLHALCPCPIENEDREKILKDANQSLGKTGKYPQMVILIAARFPRVMWKYEAMAYSLILKNTGVLMQTMYLVATAMDLAPCALGSGDSDHFAKLANTDCYEETTVGEFILGAR